jgi:hypothetical protein
MRQLHIIDESKGVLDVRRDELPDIPSHQEIQDDKGDTIVRIAESNNVRGKVIYLMPKWKFEIVENEYGDRFLVALDK